MSVLRTEILFDFTCLSSYLGLGYSVHIETMLHSKLKKFFL